MGGMKEQLEEFVERLRKAAGENVEAVVLYGSAARDDFDEKYSDINLLCVLRQAPGSALDQVAPVVEWWEKVGHRPPLFLTTEELRTSADVFAIETLDIKANHRILHGTDVLTAIDVPMNLHRVQLEHELRTVLLKLRQQYLLAPHSNNELEKVLAKSASSVATLLRHALIAAGHQSAESKRSVLTKAGEVFGLDVAAFHAVLDLREGRRVEFSMSDLYQRYMESLTAVVRQIDVAAPKKYWQRVDPKS